MKQKTFFSLSLSALLLTSISCSQIAKLKTSATPTAPAPDPNALKAAGFSGGYPIATPLIDPATGAPMKDHYVSPFPPYNPIAARGFKSGQKAGDPSTVKVNPTTGKPDKSTMKIFMLP